MAGFEPRSTGIGIYRSANCITTTAPCKVFCQITLLAESASISFADNMEWM